MLKMKFLGHKNPKDDSEQLLSEHLFAVSLLAEKFASEFGESAIGKIVGLYHDIGKYSKEFQKYIRSEQKMRVDHSTAGAYELSKVKNHVNLISAFCIAGHHGGLMNIGKTQIPDENTFFGRLNKNIPNYDAYKKEIEVPHANSTSKLLNGINLTKREKNFMIVRKGLS